MDRPEDSLDPISDYIAKYRSYLVYTMLDELDNESDLSKAIVVVAYTMRQDLASLPDADTSVEVLVEAVYSLFNITDEDTHQTVYDRIINEEVHSDDFDTKPNNVES